MGRAGAVLVELSVVEQRYHAVMEVAAGVPVTQVAARYGVSRQSVHSWVRKYEQSGLAGLADRSHRPVSCPHRITGEVEAVVCELRRRHPGWGPRRLVHELERRGIAPVPSRATVYRVPVRNGLVEPGVRKRRRSDYRRWERSAAMELWQMDIVGGILLGGGGECKMVTGIDEHSRFMVIAKVVERATARAVCRAFGEGPAAVRGARGGADGQRQAVHRPVRLRTVRGDDVRPDLPGKRHHPSPHQAAVIDHHGEDRTLPPDTQTRTPRRTRPVRRPRGRAVGSGCLAGELQPDAAAPGPGHGRPGEPVRPPPRAEQDALPVVLPARLDLVTPAAPPDPPPPEPAPVAWPLAEGEIGAIEVERQVPASGNLSLRGQQIWFGPALASTTVTLRIDVNRLHVLIGGARHKTLPSKLSGRDLKALLASGAARPARA